jgi:hypothetical protein
MLGILFFCTALSSLISAGPPFLFATYSTSTTYYRIRRAGELLYRDISDTFYEAKNLIGRWVNEYNTIRPNSALGYHPSATEANLLVSQNYSVFLCLTLVYISGTSIYRYFRASTVLITIILIMFSITFLYSGINYPLSFPNPLGICSLEFQRSQPRDLY